MQYDAAMTRNKLEIEIDGRKIKATGPYACRMARDIIIRSRAGACTNERGIVDFTIIFIIFITIMLITTFDQVWYVVVLLDRVRMICEIYQWIRHK